MTSANPFSSPLGSHPSFLPPLVCVVFLQFILFTVSYSSDFPFNLSDPYTYLYHIFLSISLPFLIQPHVFFFLFVCLSNSPFLSLSLSMSANLSLCSTA